MKLEEHCPTLEHNDPKEQEPPFTIDLVKSPRANEPEAKNEILFPCTYRTELVEVKLVKDNENGFLEEELSAPKLDSIHDYLWLAGLPVPPHPLHYQLVLQREIVICEKMDMHLVWGNGRIYIKPLPLFLLSPAFWETNLQCVEGCDCFHSDNYSQSISPTTIRFGMPEAHAQ